VSRLVVVEYVSLDGVVQAPGHAGEDPEGGFAAGGWTGPFMAEHRRYNTELFQTAGAFLLGRLTYQIFAAYWPTVTDPDDQVARALNTLPKYVASTSLDDPGWQPATVIGGDLPTRVRKLKAEPGRPILTLGSPSLVQGLLRDDLIDEYQLWLHPVVLGRGKRLFADGGPAAALRLVDGRTTGGGLVILTYQVAGRPAGMEVGR